MKREFSAGGIVFNNLCQVLLTQHSTNKYWSFPKGLIDPGQTGKETAVREVKEEGGVEAEIIDKVGDSKYVYTPSESKPAPPDKRASRGREKVFKIVSWFLMRYISGDPKDHDWEVSEAGWFEPEKALEKLSFSRDKLLLKKALEMQAEKGS